MRKIFFIITLLWVNNVTAKKADYKEVFIYISYDNKTFKQFKEPKLEAIEYYNSNGNKASCIYFNTNGFIESTTMYQSDSNNRCVDYYDFDFEGKVKDHFRSDSASFKYKENVPILFLDEFHSDDNLCHCKEFKKNERGDIIEEIIYFNTHPTMIMQKYKYVYVYNAP